MTKDELVKKLRDMAAHPSRDPDEAKKLLEALAAHVQTLGDGRCRGCDCPACIFGFPDPFKCYRHTCGHSIYEHEL